MRFGKPAVILAGFVATWGAIDPFGLLMLRRKSFRQLRAEKRERGHTEQRGEVAGSGIVADKAVRPGELIKQGVEIRQGVIQHGHAPSGSP